MIEAQGLSKKYRKKIAVDDISFTVETGKVTGFLGPNGAGKSTAMRLMLGLDKGKGETTFDGKRLTEYSRPSQAVGILLEAKAFHPTRTARHHLKVLADAGGVAISRVDEVLDIVGLRAVANKRPGKFSLGMSQRLGIAAAILGSPKYLLLDEPANGLDPEGIAWLREFIKNYAKDGNAVFISSHLLSEMALMADNIVVIGRGRLIADTSMATILSGSTHTGVFVRTPHTNKLAQALTKKHIAYTKDNDGLTITGSNSQEVGNIAFKAKVPVYELVNRSASLEEAFLELTAEAQEYATQQEGKES